MNQFSYGIMHFFLEETLQLYGFCGVIYYITAAMNGCGRQVSVTYLYSTFKVLDHYSSFSLGCIENMVKVEAITIKRNTVWLCNDLCNFILLCSLLVKNQ